MSDPTSTGPDTAMKLWSQLEAMATEVIDRAERHAAWTIPSLFLESGTHPDQDNTAPLWQSVGAQLVNNLSTRLMLALFAPSRPFLRLDPSEDLEALIAAQKADETLVRAVLSKAERKAVKTLDRLALRPKLYELLKHLIVIGNVLSVMDRSSKTLRVMSLKHWRIKRDVLGRMHTLCIKECVARDELDTKHVEALPPEQRGGAEDTKVDYFIVVRRQYPDDRYKVEHWINETHLEEFDKTYSEEECPYKVLTWSLADEANYGTSLVGEYEGDFAGLTQASASQIAAAVLASEFRWLVDPAGGTSVDDFKESANGEAIPGTEGSVALLNAAAQLSGSLQITHQIITDYVNRLGRGFIMTSAITRDAERVTAEEIRLLANELENGLGGGYSRLAVDLQRPLGLFLLALSGVGKIDGKEIEVTVVTGLDALSRSGDLEALRGWVADMQLLNTIPEDVRATLDIAKLVLDLATPRGVEATKYIKAKEAQVADANADAARDAATQRAARGENQQ